MNSLVFTRFFSIAVIALLCFELLAPFSYAQTTPPTPGSIVAPASGKSVACPAVYEIKPDERKLLWDKTMGFQPTQINDLALDEALKNRDVEKYKNPVLDPNSAPRDEDYIRVIDLAQIMLEDPVTVAKEIGLEDKLTKDDKVPADLRVPLSVAQAYAEAKGRASSENPIIKQLRAIGLYESKGTTILPTPTPTLYDNKKIAFASEKTAESEIALKDLFKANSLNASSCLFNEKIRGKTTYVAVLDKDLTYGNPSKDIMSGLYYGSTERIKSTPPTPAPKEWQWEAAKKGGKLAGKWVLKPVVYDFGIKTVGDFITPPEIDQGAQVLLNGTKKIFLPKTEPGFSLNQPGPPSGVNQHFTGTEVLSFLSLNGGGNILIPSFYEQWIIDIKHINDWQMFISFAAGVGATAARTNIERVRVDQEDLLSTLERQGTIQSRVLGGHAVNVPADVQQEATSVFNHVSRKMTGINSEFESYQSLRLISEKLQRSVTPYLTTSLLFGTGWIGPARMLFELNTRLLLSAQGSNNDKYVKLIVNRNPAPELQDSSNFLGLGRIQEFIGEYTGLTAPEKAFKGGKIFLINQVSDKDPHSQRSETTFMSYSPNSTSTYATVQTNWAGRSFATNFEDIRELDSKEKFTSLPLVTNNIMPGSVVKRKLGTEIEKYSAAVAVPLLVSKGVFSEVGRVFGITTFFLAGEQAFEFDENFGKGIECNPQTYADLKQTYITWTTTIAATQFFVTLYPLLPAATYTGAIRARQTLANSYNALTGKYARLVTRSLGDFASWTSPAQVFQLYWGNRAITYFSNCKDPMYKILTYQPLSAQAVNQTNGIQEKLKPIQDLLSTSTSTKDSIKTIGSATEAELQKMTEILNLRTTLQNQVGAVWPESLYYIHVKNSEFSTPRGLFKTLTGNSCVFQENYQDGSNTTRFTTKGVELFNKDGNKIASFTGTGWDYRSLARLRAQELGRIVLPNKIIETNLDATACAGAFIQVRGDGIASLVGTCNSADCLRSRIQEVTGKSILNDLSQVLGRVSSVDTETGTASFTDTGIRFIKLIGGNNFGQEFTGPDLSYYNQSSLRTQIPKSQLTVFGDGRVEIDSQDIGKLATIIGEYGKIEYDSTSGKLLLFIYVLSQTPLQNIKDISVSASQNPDGKAIKIEATEKTGAETGLKEALKNVQGTGGMQSLETKDHLYYFTKDAAGNDVLRVVDKKTGEVKDYKITGPITTDKDGNILVPTDKGTFKFNFDKDGNLSVDGPDGLKELLPLLVARGQNGILTFNPSTGAINVYNGQDIPLSPEFASKGIGFSADANGNTRGIPENNLFGTERLVGEDEIPSQQNILQLPSWPENLLAAAVMLFIILTGIGFVRLRSRPGEEQ